MRRSWMACRTFICAERSCLSALINSPYLLACWTICDSSSGALPTSVTRRWTIPMAFASSNASSMYRSAVRGSEQYIAALAASAQVHTSSERAPWCCNPEIRASRRTQASAACPNVTRDAHNAAVAVICSRASSCFSARARAFSASNSASWGFPFHRCRVEQLIKIAARNQGSLPPTSSSARLCSLSASSKLPWSRRNSPMLHKSALSTRRLGTRARMLNPSWYVAIARS